MLKWTVTKRSENGSTDSSRGDTRRSLGVLPSTPAQSNRENRRRSLGVTSTAIKRHPHRDKENHFLGTPHHPRDSFGPTSALRDVSNITPTSTPTCSSTLVSGSRKRSLNPQSLRPLQYAPTLPTFDIEYSPCNLRTEPTSSRDLDVTDTYHEYPRYLPDDPPPRKKAKVWKKSPSEPCLTPLSHRLNELRFSKMKFRPERKRKFGTSPQDTSLSSSTMGDVTLDRMIDAILESAKKEKPTPINRRTSTFKNKDKPADLKAHFARFREQISVSPTYTPAEDPASDLIEFNSKIIISPEKFTNDRTIILEESTVVNEREVKTPDETKENCCLRRQKAVRRKHHKSDVDRITKENREKRRCLIGLSLPDGIPSPGTPIAFNVFPTTESAKERRRKSIDALAAMDTPEGFAIIVDSDPKDYVRQKETGNVLKEFPDEETSGINSNELRASSTPTGASVSLSGGISRRCLTFSPEFEDESLEKRRSVASSTNSRYGRNVTGSLDLAIFLEETKLNIHVIRCRDLQRANGRSINAYVKISLLPTEPMEERDTGFQRTAVHRNSSRPYFDHRFTFDLKDMDHAKRIQLSVWHRDRENKRSEFLGCLSFPVRNVVKKEINGSYKLQSQSCLTNPACAVAMGENSQSSVDEVVSLDDVGGDHGSQSTIAFSKKALHQRDADENLFLRFLELDPPGDVTVANRRQSTTKPSNGRTPFTMTKRLTRTSESRGFGFSIVWTHPPRVEKVEAGQSAERAGIWPGDYVIFVDKHNVVTMPEVDILNLIRSQGNSLTLEIFRRAAAQPQRASLVTHTTPSTSHQTPVHVHSHVSDISSHQQNGPQLQRLSSGTQLAGTRSSIACSNASISAETTKRRLHLPQVTFSKESILPQSGDDQRRRYLYQLISREQHFVNALQFGMQRFTSPLRERKDLISPSDHRTLFQNIDELQRISEDILEQLVQDDIEPQVHYASRVYMSKTTAICVAYKKYCNGLKRADCVLVNKSRHANSEFVKFITEPQVPRKRPDLTSFIHRPLQHFREVLKLIQVTASHCRLDSEEYRNFSQVVLELQAAYREITVGGGLMEPLGEGKPLLTLQDLESRLVFTRCKPFVLASPGRQWVFGGDLSRVEGRSIKPYWTLLFSDILLFAKVSRDRVLFITEEPLPLVNITDSCFNIRKKSTEFRLTIDPLGRSAESPTAHCTPDLTKTPRRNSRRRSIILRAPSPELKAVWQNLLQRQIFLVNATLGSTPLSSPLDSPDVMQTLIPLSDIGATTASMASIKLSSVDSLAAKSSQQQVRPSRITSSSCTSVCNPKTLFVSSSNTSRPEVTPATTSSISLSAIPEITTELSDPVHTIKSHSKSYHEDSIGAKSTYFTELRGPKMREFAVSSVGRSFIDESSSPIPESTIQTPDTPSANISPSSSNQFSETFSNYEFNLHPSIMGAKISPERRSSKRTESSSCAGSWDLLELDLDFHQEPDNTTASDSSKYLVEEFIDEKCRQLNKSGTSRGGAVHLALWMKGQLDQAKKIALQNQSEPIESEPEEDETIEEWTTEQVKKRSRELQLIDATGRCQVPKTDGASKSKENASNAVNRTDDLSAASEVEDESKSASRSTTSDSQITVRSSPIAHAGDTLSVCRQCHKNCSKRNLSHSSASTNSLKVQHAQKNAGGGRCCQASTTASSITSGTSSSASTTTITTGEVELRTTAIRKTHQTPIPNGFSKRHIMCHCNCTPQDFHGTTISPDEVTQETCKILDGVHEIKKVDQPNHINHTHPHGKCKCSCKDEEKKDPADDWSLMLIGLSKINPTSTQMHIDPFEAVPSISVVPPTPDGVANSSRAHAQTWDGAKGGKITKSGSKEDENSPEDESPQDEPPYKVLSTLRRYGTLSSLEKLPSEDAETYNSSDDDGQDDGDIRIVTKEVYGVNDAYNPSLRNWTARAGSYMAEKMSFFEESRAFFDKYLGRWDRDTEQYQLAGSAGIDDENLDECPSGATSGEDVWGTPTSGGENDEIQMFNSDHTHSSPTSSSFTGDDDTELMMDELLMAPPMTASAVRGLLPRRRLEPLFEEDTESGESEEENMPLGGRTTINQGQVVERNWSRNGPTSKDSPESTTSETLSDATVSTPREMESTVILMPTEVADTMIQDAEVSVLHVPTKVEEESGSGADICFSPSQTLKDARKSAESIDHAEGSSNAAVHVGLSPRLEMRLALNRDIMGDEDLINYDPGPDLTTILGHDLSTYQRLTGRDLMTRSANPRVAIVKEAGSNSYYQQKNSKMDTPTPNRKKSNPSTWNSSVSVDLVDEKKLTDLERLARREKMYCMSQLKSGQLAVQTDPTRNNSPNTTPSRRPSKIFTFLTRRNSENLKVFPKEMEDELSVSSKTCSPRRDNDKALERRFWKQLTRRRRHSVSEISAN
ncbi:hypothetical protein DMENIID0001_103010 [Sergentomyia squamirostris]